MKFLLRYIYKLIIKNTVKLTFLLFGLTSLYLNLYYIETYYVSNYKVLSEFEVYNDKYIVYEYNDNSDKFKSQKLSNDIIIKDGFLITDEATPWYVTHWVIFVVCMILFLFMPLSEDGGWDFNYIYYNCMLVDIKIDREGSKLYYNYKVSYYQFMILVLMSYTILNILVEVDLEKYYAIIKNHLIYLMIIMVRGL